MLKPFCGGCSLWLLCNSFFSSCFYVSVCLSSSCWLFKKDTTGEIISAIILAFVDYCCNSDLDRQTFIYTLLHCQAQFPCNFCGSTIILTCQSYINKGVCIVGWICTRIYLPHSASQPALCTVWAALRDSAAEGPGEQLWHLFHTHQIHLRRGWGGDKANCADSCGVARGSCED